MTKRQAQLIDAEISRHISLALVAEEPAMKRIHLEVAQALSAALTLVEERRAEKCKSRTLGIRIGSLLQLLRVSHRDRAPHGKRRSPGP